MKTTMSKTDNDSRQLAARQRTADETTGARIQDNRGESLAQMKLMESLQKKEELQRQAGLEDEEEVPK
jgi:hypothetical protein